MQKEKRSLKKYGYLPVIVGLCFLMILVGLGFCSSNRSIYLAPITEALGIKRSLFTLSDTIRFITTAVVTMFFGSMVNRFGMKKLIVAGLVCLILCMCCYVYTDQVWGFWIGSVFLGTGLSWTTTTMVGCVINKWSKKNQGTIIGAILSANGLGSALATQIVSPLIYEEGNPFGYRNAYKLIMVLLIIVCVLMLLFFKEKKEETYESDAESGKAADKDDKVAASGRRVWQLPYFIPVAVCIFLTGFVLQGIGGGGIGSAHMQDVGLDPVYIAATVSIHSLGVAGFKFLAGVLYDRFGIKMITTVCDVAAVISFLLLAFVADTDYGKSLAMIYAVISAVALPLETVMMPIFAGALFDKRDYNKILGMFVSINMAGFSLGAPIINAAYDATGSYRGVLLICGAVMVGVTICFQYIMRVAKKEEKTV